MSSILTTHPRAHDQVGTLSWVTLQVRAEVPTGSPPGWEQPRCQPLRLHPACPAGALTAWSHRLQAREKLAEGESEIKVQCVPAVISGTDSSCGRVLRLSSCPAKGSSSMHTRFSFCPLKKESQKKNSACQDIPRVFSSQEGPLLKTFSSYENTTFSNNYVKVNYFHDLFFSTRTIHFKIIHFNFTDIKQI